MNVSVGKAVMNKIARFSWPLLFVGIAISCDTSLLNTTPDYKLVEGNFWKSQADTEAALTGVYAILRWDGVYGNEATPLWEETASPNAYNETDSKSFSSIARGLQSAGSGGVIGTRWNRSYGGIGRANYFLANADKVEMDENLLERMKGEAKFLRALYYFNLQAYYGGAPLILDPPELEQSDMTRSPRKDIVAQILKDLDEAAAVLPETYGESEQGRATRGAALALRARVLLYEASPLFREQQIVTGSGEESPSGQSGGELWKAAADAAKAVMDMNAYRLFPDYRTLFLPENENNEEVIFDVQYIFPDAGNSFDLICRQYNTNAPLQDLVNAYHMSDGQPASESPLYDPGAPYQNRDPRFYDTVVFPGDTYMGEEVTEDRFAITGYGLEKYSIYTEEEPPAGKSDLKGGQSETNYMVIRYAHMLLAYAEAQNEYAGPGPSVYNALNQVRERAGMPDIQPGHSQDELREIIRHERRIELAGEGFYYNDIRRWKIAEEVMNAPIRNWQGEVITERKFDAGRDYWWPIPQEELDLNPALEQNEGY